MRHYNIIYRRDWHRTEIGTDVISKPLIIILLYLRKNKFADNNNDFTRSTR